MAWTLASCSVLLLALLAAFVCASPILQEDDITPEAVLTEQRPDNAPDLKHHVPVSFTFNQGGTKQWKDGMYWDKSWGRKPTDPQLHEKFAIKNDGSYATYRTPRMAYAHHRELTPSCHAQHVNRNLNVIADRKLMKMKMVSKAVPAAKWLQKHFHWIRLLKKGGQKGVTNFAAIQGYCNSECLNWMNCIRHNAQTGSDGRDCSGCPRRCFVCECMNPVGTHPVTPPKTGLFSCAMTPYDTANFCPQNCVNFSTCAKKGTPPARGKKPCALYPRRCVQCECLAKGYPSDFNEGHPAHLKTRKRYCPECTKTKDYEDPEARYFQQAQVEAETERSPENEDNEDSEDNEE